MKKYLAIILTFSAILAKGQQIPKTTDNSVSPAKVEEQTFSIPKFIAYQGKLVDSSGQPVEDGKYVMIFSLYDSVGRHFYRETKIVETKGGLFSVLLSVDSFPFISMCSLGIRILPSDKELTPRHNIVSVPFAYLANNSANSHQLQGKDTTAFVFKGRKNSICDTMFQDNSVNSAKIKDSTITSADLAPNFKAPKADTAYSLQRYPPDSSGKYIIPYTDSTGKLHKNVIPPAISCDSARVATNSHKLQGKDTTAFVFKGRKNSICDTMLQDNSVNSAKIKDSTITSADLAPGFALLNDSLMGIDTIPARDSIVGIRNPANTYNCLIFLTIGPTDNAISDPIKVKQVRADSIFISTISNNPTTTAIPFQYLIIPKR